MKARRLVDSLEAGRRATFHAKYTVSGAADPSQSIVLELWRKGIDLRQDTIVEGGTESGHAASFFHGDTITSCTQPVGGSWSCKPAAAGSLPGPDALVQQLTDQLGGISVRATDETISGVASRCYLLEIPSDAAKVCVRSDGVPTLIASGEQTA